MTRALLETKLGHKLEEMTVNELRDLSNIYNGIVDGMVRVKEVFPDDDQPARKPDLPKTPVSAPAPKAAPKTTQAPPPVTARRRKTVFPAWMYRRMRPPLALLNINP